MDGQLPAATKARDDAQYSHKIEQESTQATHLQAFDQCRGFETTAKMVVKELDAACFIRYLTEVNDALMILQ